MIEWLKSLFGSFSPIFNKTYRVLENKSANNPIIILKGKYTNVAFYVGQVRPRDDGVIGFDYEIASNPKGLNLEEDSKFHRIMGDIIVDLFERNLKISRQERVSEVYEENEPST